MNKREYDDLPVNVIEDALACIDPNCSRDAWARIAMALKSELGEGGFMVFDRWSADGDSYNAKDCRDTWRSIKPAGGVHIGTLIYEAQQHGFAFNDNGPRLTASEIDARRQQREAEHRQQEAERRRLQGEAAKLANLTWEAAWPALDDHPYLQAKGVKSHGLRVGDWPLINDAGEVFRRVPGALLAAIVDAKNGKIISLQGIMAGIEGDIQKRYLRNGRKQGGYHIIGRVPEPGQVLAFCEGYATGATIHELTGWTVVVTFDAPNLPVVAELLRGAFPKAAFVICADNDAWTSAGNVDNPGVHYAQQAAKVCSGKVLVPAFQDVTTRPTDFNDLATLEGAVAARAQLLETPITAPKTAPAPANDNALTEPFRVLGYDHDRYFVFQCEKNQLIEMTKGDMSENGFLELAPAEWWGMNFPKAKALFDKTAATDWLIRTACRAGIYDPECIRGRGAWMDAGRTVFHFGNALWVDGGMMPVSAIKSEYVYEMDRRLSHPADKPLTDAEGGELAEVARMFRWTKPASAALLAGWVALAPMCGAMRWRPHIWITGGAGCGKTTVLNEYVHRLMGGLDIFAQGNSTEAGIRQTLRSDALPVLFDESEQNNEREVSRVQNVLSLIRQASSESAAKTLKGTAGGDAMQFTIRSMFCLSSIQVGMKHQADFERLTVLALRPKREELDAADSWQKLKDRLYLIGRDETLPRRLLRRSLDLLPVTLQNIQVFVDAASRKFGSVREGDQYGTLMAGCWSLMHSTVATPMEAATLIDAYDWEEYRENVDADESMKALSAMMECQLHGAKGGTFSLFEVVMAAACIDMAAGIQPVDADLLLQRHGMRLVGGDLLLSNNSHAMSDMMRNTAYAADIRGQLLRVPGVHRCAKSVRFNGVVSKCIAIPLRLLTDGGDRPF